MSNFDTLFCVSVVACIYVFTLLSLTKSMGDEMDIYYKTLYDVRSTMGARIDKMVARSALREAVLALKLTVVKRNLYPCIHEPLTMVNGSCVIDLPPAVPSSGRSLTPSEQVIVRSMGDVGVRLNRERWGSVDIRVEGTEFINSIDAGRFTLDLHPDSTLVVRREVGWTTLTIASFNGQERLKFT